MDGSADIELNNNMWTHKGISFLFLSKVTDLYDHKNIDEKSFKRRLFFSFLKYLQMPSSTIVIEKQKVQVGE